MIHDSQGHMEVCRNRGTPKSSILIGVSIINYPLLGYPHLWKAPYPSTKKLVPPSNYKLVHKPQELQGEAPIYDS